MDKWINKNYETLKKICEHITKGDDADELLHFCLEQVMKNKKFNAIENPQEKVYFFSRVAKTNYKSLKSPYYLHYRRYGFYKEIGGLEIVDQEYVERDVDMEWVEDQIKEMKRGKDWYFGRLFELYIECGCSITDLSKLTTIPINSVSRDIRKVRDILIKKRKDKLYGM